MKYLTVPIPEELHEDIKHMYNRIVRVDAKDLRNYEPKISQFYRMLMEVGLKQYKNKKFK